MDNVLTHRPRVVIFDLDNTLFDSMPLLNACQNSVAAAFGQGPISPQQTHELTVNTLEIILLKLTGAETLPDEQKAEHIVQGRTIYTDVYREKHFQFLKAMPGADALLQRLHADGVILAVNTNKRRMFAEPELEKLGWAPLFAAIVTPGDTPDGHNKPHPASTDFVLQCVAEKTGRKFACGPGVWMVGDTHGDVECAINITSVLVAADYSHPAKPTMHHASLFDVLAAYEKLLPAPPYKAA